MRRIPPPSPAPLSRAALALALTVTVTASSASAVAGRPGAIPMPAYDSPAPVSLHTRLIESQPAEGDTLSESPTEIRLEFSAAVQANLARVLLTDASGVTDTLTVRARPDTPQVLIAAVSRLHPGPHRVSWRVVSADGHPVSGTYVFYVAAEAVAAQPEGEPGAAPAEAGTGEPDRRAPVEERIPPHPGADGEDAGADGGFPDAAALIRGLATLVLMGLAGALALSAWAAPAFDPRVRRVVGVLAVAAPVLLGAHIFFWAGRVLPAGSMGLSALADLLATPAGILEMARLGMALLALWAIGLARAPALAAGFAIAAVALGGAIGHAAVVVPALSIPARAVHLLAASLWLGGLLLLVGSDPAAEEYPRLTARVSAVALGAVAVVALTGAIQALMLLPDLSALVGSGYGRLILGKVAGLALLLVFGARHRFVLIPRATAEGPTGLRRSVRWETGVMVLVILLAGWLSYIPAPVMEGM